MAADWIKIEHSLPCKPEVMELSRLLDIDEMTVVGHLVCFWSWVDQNLSPICPSTSGTKKGLDRVAGREGFVDAMVTVGWLEFDGHTVTVPNYEHHLSQSAKKRAFEARKKTRQRSVSPVVSPKCPPTVGTKSGQKEGLENRREEKSIKEQGEESVAVAPSAVAVVNRDSAAAPAAEIIAEFDAAFGCSSIMTDKRQSAIRARWRDPWWRGNWKTAIARGKESAFLRGANDRNWVIDFEFFLRPDSVAKIVEGKYDNRTASQSALTASQRREQSNASSFDWIERAAAEAASGSC